MDPVERQLLDRIYRLQCECSKRRIDSALRDALEEEITHCLLALRLWRDSAHELDVGSRVQ